MRERETNRGLCGMAGERWRGEGREERREGRGRREGMGRRRRSVSICMYFCKVRGQLSFHCVFQGLNSGSQTCAASIIHSKPSYQPCLSLFSFFFFPFLSSLISLFLSFFLPPFPFLFICFLLLDRVLFSSGWLWARCASKYDFELTVLLPSPSECWGYRDVPLCRLKCVFKKHTYFISYFGIWKEQNRPQLGSSAK